MDQEKFLKEKRANSQVGMLMVFLYFVWLPIYLIFVRPVMNAWLANYISGYPAILHLIPIFGVPFLICWPLFKIFPAPKISLDDEIGIN